MKREIHKATIIEIIDDRNIRVMVEEGMEMIASISGKVRMTLHSKIEIGEEIIVEVSPFDKTRCRVTYR